MHVARNDLGPRPAGCDVGRLAHPLRPKFAYDLAPAEPPVARVNPTRSIGSRVNGRPLDPTGNQFRLRRSSGVVDSRVSALAELILTPTQCCPCLVQDTRVIGSRRDGRETVQGCGTERPAPAPHRTFHEDRAGMMFSAGDGANGLVRQHARNGHRPQPGSACHTPLI